ncbi:MAG: c-type cytochrome domain-containing protein [Gemmataceae bacterium]
MTRRVLFILPLLVVVPTWGLAQDAKKERQKGEEPIKVIQLNRSEPVVYEKDIEPIFVNKCLVCHSGAVTEGKFDLGTFEALMKGGKKGAPVVPGKSAESLLVKLVSKEERPYMPPRREEPLTPEELALIKLWIDQGAKPPSMARVKPKPVLSTLPPNFTPVRAVAVSSDKSTVAAGRANHIHIYDAGAGNYIRSLTAPDLKAPDGQPMAAAHLSVVDSLAFSPDGRFLASGSYGEVLIWDVQAGTVRHHLTDFADRVVALAFSPNGKLLATGGGAPTEDGELKVFDVDSGKLVVHIKDSHSDTIYGVCFSPDNTRLASCGADKFVKIFEIPSGKFEKAFEGHTHHVMDVGWRGDGKFLASGGADNAVKIWDYEKGEQVRTINAHNKQVTRLLFLGSTNQFVTSSGDQLVTIWNSDNGGRIRNLAGSTDFLYALGVSPEGDVVATGGQEGIVRLYNGKTGALIKALSPPGADSTEVKN